MKKYDRQNLSPADGKIIGDGIRQSEAPIFDENDSFSGQPASETAFERIRNHHASEALLTSLGDYFDKRFAAEYDEIQSEMEDISVPDDLDQQMRTLVRKHGRDAGKQESVQRRRKRTGILIKACVIVLAVSLAVGVLTAPQASALRMKIYRIFTEQHDGNMSVMFEERDADEAEEQSAEETSVASDAASDETGSVVFPEGIEYVLCPAKIPDGYELSEVTQEGNALEFIFR